MKTQILLHAIGLVLLMSACSSSQHVISSAPSSLPQRDPARALQLSAEAAAVLDADPAKAETLLNESLRFDLFCGPAHNNLGVIHLTQNRLYEAASEFEAARRLMPGHPDPRCNLALVYERAGRLDDAVGAYEAALEARPGHLPSMQGLASLLVRAGRTDARTATLLEDIALQSDSSVWRDWAIRERLALSAASTAPAP